MEKNLGGGPQGSPWAGPWAQAQVLSTQTLRVSKTSFSEVLGLSSVSWKKAFIEHGEGIFQRLV